jgi:hypothetical protein
MTRRFLHALVLTFCIAPLQCATLERLSLDDMIVKSTAIVRGRITATYAAMSGPIVYTHYTLQVSERFKGPSQGPADVAVPGGTLNGQRYIVEGAPEFHVGQEYVFFLFTGKPTKDETLVMRLSELRARVAATLTGGKGAAK